MSTVETVNIPTVELRCTCCGHDHRLNAAEVTLSPPDGILVFTCPRSGVTAFDVLGTSQIRYFLRAGVTIVDDQVGS